MKSPSPRDSFKPSSLLASAGQPRSLFGRVRDALLTIRGGGASRARAYHTIPMEPMEPRTMLAANINYTYSAADILHFNDGDLQNNNYAVAIADVGGSDHLQIKAE